MDIYHKGGGFSINIFHILHVGIKFLTLLQLQDNNNLSFDNIDRIAL